MKHNLIWLVTSLFFLTGCTSGTLSVGSVSYQSLRTDFAQPKKIPEDAKIAVEFFFNTKGEMQPVVYNLTSEILTVDQTKSFLVRPDGTSVSYYDPTVRTTTTGNYNSNTEGLSFNLGGVASALGVGGVLGALASATTVGSSQTAGTLNQNTITIVDQPKISIGPKGCVAMSKAFTIDGIGFPALDSYNNQDIVDIAPNASNVKFSFCISYSLDDKNYDKLVTNFYVSSNIRVPISDRKVSEGFYKIYELKPDALAENMYMFLLPNNIVEVSTDGMGNFIYNGNVYDTYIQGTLIDFK